MSDTRETIEPDRDAHNKLMATFYEWWRAGSAVIPSNDALFDVLEEYGWIETGRRCSWDQWPNERDQTPGSKYVMIARLTDRGRAQLLEWMREAEK